MPWPDLQTATGDLRVTAITRRIVLIAGAELSDALQPALTGHTPPGAALNDA